MLSLTQFLKLIFPEKCVGCSKYPSILCDSCKHSQITAKSNCYICKTPSEKFKTHYNCKLSPPILNVYICYDYTKVIESLVISLKYRFYIPVAEEIASLITNSANTPNLCEYNIIPTPIHWKRKNQRGFNQCELILDRINLLHNNKLNIINCLHKNSPTIKQLGHSKKERESNLKNSFTCITSPKINENKKFLIFDDICTTGATINECANAIKKTYPNAEISALVLSRG